jgi:hypothetical protein
MTIADLLDWRLWIETADWLICNASGDLRVMIYWRLADCRLGLPIGIVDWDCRLGLSIGIDDWD